MRPRPFRVVLPVALAAAAFACADQLATAPDASLVRPSLDIAAAAARTAPRAIQINEFHYDNDGTDAGEFIEILGPAGASLAGWQVVLYNGSNGAAYGTRTLTSADALGADLGGACATEGVFVLDYPSNGIQNGSPDGIALVRPDGSVAEFLSYEGPMTAVGGPADGIAATPIGPSQPASTPVGQSLFRDATSNAWAGPATATKGACNAGGVVEPPPPPPPPAGVVVISEVMANPSGIDADREWFELHNPGTTPIDVQGWTLSSNLGSHTIASSTVIPAGGYALLARNGNAATNGGLPAIAYVYPGAAINLNNSNGWLRIRSAAGATVDSVAWASVPDGSSRALGNPAADNVDLGSAAWFTSTEAYGAGGNGTPGAANGSGTGGGTRISIVGRSLSDPPLPVGFQDQLFADLLDASNNEIPSTFTWSTTTPALISIDANGVVTALGEGDGIVTVRADANGATRTWRVPTIVATASTTARYEGNAAFGEPTDATPGDDFLIRRAQYTASYNPTLGTPNWVAYNLEDSHIGTSFDRCDCFTPDAAWPASFPRILTSDYTGSGYSRGHLVKSADRTAGNLDNAVTFYFSNIIPQTSANNGGAWLQLENYLSDLADDSNKEIYVLAGRAGSLGTLKNEGKVDIPASVWKVAIIMDRDEGLADVDDASDFQLIAINIPNGTSLQPTWQAYETTVDAIEALTGYDLLALLPDRLERIVESGTRAPVANPGGPYVALEDEAVRLDGTASSDPDGDAITYAWTFGDGATGTGATPAHTYASAGTYSVALTVTDVYGAEHVATTMVTVRTRQALLRDLVAYLDGVSGLGAGNANALQASLRAAIASLDRGSTASAIGQLQAFTNKVSAFSDAGRLSTAAAVRMTTDAGRVIASIRAN